MGETANPTSAAVGEVLACLAGRRPTLSPSVARRWPALHAGTGLTVVARADAAREALGDPRLVVGDGDGRLPALRISPHDDLDAVFRAMPSLRDGSAHARLRRLVAPYFTRRRASAARAAIAEAVERTWPADAGEGFDFVSGYADRLPVRLALLVMGLPAGDADELERWARLLRDRIGPGAGPSGEEADALAGELAALRRYVRGALAAADGGPLYAVGEAVRTGTADEAEGFALFVLLLTAGLETLSQALAQAAHRAAAEPELLARLREEPDRAHDAFRSTLRAASPLRMLARRAACPASVGGLALPAGQTVVLLLASALAGEDAGPGPRTGPEAALAYGHGPHICLGMHHADLAGAEFLRFLAGRPGRLALLPGAVPHRSPAVQGWSRLPVRELPPEPEPEPDPTPAPGGRESAHDGANRPAGGE
ncbi:putative cytochrome P450 [Actinacidiphila reveromycinica]|uniref:Putative cytochrome P450 n=1 Tax=Actinacidiphila reveromycinica TaxID=659352 RepID=A0A7U3UP46_9ACTN|nr:cytochrome P450 [Streptomyces sp. SN-593]BBA96106.1 putative cytochrome P450 [Streptomyces sp. SN-593]